MTPLTVVLLKSLLTVTATMTCLWVYSVARRDASIVDPFWGTGFIVVAWFTLTSLPPGHDVMRSRLLAALTTIWGLRLSLYLLWRNWAQGEDRRYQAMRERVGVLGSRRTGIVIPAYQDSS